MGVALAQELWGGRFEVVVATHLDNAHLHNHFVVNSVSFADGRRFHRDAACYRAMREASDELCREHGLSVVESPGAAARATTPNGRAEREGRPTWRSLVKADVDEAVGRAASMRQFHANLRAMGYDVKVGKDISVRPARQGAFRAPAPQFRGRVLAGGHRRAHPRQQPPAPAPRQAEARSQGAPPVPKGTLVSLYRRYMALLNGAKRQRAPGGRAHFLLREDLRELEAISGELALLAREGIETRSQLAAYERALADKSEALQAERRALRNEARRSKAAGSPRAPKPPHRRDSVGAAGRKARGARLRAHPGKKLPSCRPASRRSRAPKRTERKGRWKVMDASSEAAEQIVRMTLEGTEVALRITGAGAKNAAAMLLAAAASNEKTKGGQRLSADAQIGRELRVFPIRFDDLKGFAKEADATASHTPS